MAKMKCQLPDNVFCSFLFKGARYNGMIVAADNKNYRINYFKKFPSSSGFYHAPDYIKVPKSQILPFYRFQEL